jgi:hypothetical protein
MKYGTNRGPWSAHGSIRHAEVKFKKTARRAIRLASRKK